MRPGGLRVINPTQSSDEEFQNFTKMTEILTSVIKSQCHEIPVDFDELSRKCKLDIRSERREKQVETLEDLKLRMNSDQKRVNEIAQESGSSNWLTVLLYEDSGYFLTKQEF